MTAATRTRCCRTLQKKRLKTNYTINNCEYEHGASQVHLALSPLSLGRRKRFWLELQRWKAKSNNAHKCVALRSRPAVSVMPHRGSSSLLVGSTDFSSGSDDEDEDERDDDERDGERSRTPSVGEEEEEANNGVAKRNVRESFTPRDLEMKCSLQMSTSSVAAAIAGGGDPSDPSAAANGFPTAAASANGGLCAGCLLRARHGLVTVFPLSFATIND